MGYRRIQPRRSRQPKRNPASPPPISPNSSPSGQTTGTPWLFPFAQAHVLPASLPGSMLGPVVDRQQPIELILRFQEIATVTLRRLIAQLCDGCRIIVPGSSPQHRCGHFGSHQADGWLGTGGAMRASSRSGSLRLTGHGSGVISEPTQMRYSFAPRSVDRRPSPVRTLVRRSVGSGKWGRGCVWPR